MASDYERVLCVKNKVFVYRIPPRPSNRGYRAADWKLDAPDWTGRLRVVARGNDLFIKLEDKEGELFASCPVKDYPGIAVEAVTDSSRYFVLRIQDDNGRSAFIGIGFEDRGDSFDLNVSLQDHFKWLKQEEEAKQTTKEFNSGPKLDLGFKEGQTITINIGNKKSDSASKSRPKAQGASGGGLGILPPPPGGGIKLPAPPSGATLQQASLFESTPEQTTVTNDSSSAASSNVDFLLDFGSDSAGSTNSANTQSQTVQQPQQTSSDPWGDFTGASSQSGTGGDGGWVQF